MYFLSELGAPTLVLVGHPNIKLVLNYTIRLSYTFNFLSNIFGYQNTPVNI